MTRRELMTGDKAMAWNVSNGPIKINAEPHLFRALPGAADSRHIETTASRRPL